MYYKNHQHQAGLSGSIKKNKTKQNEWLISGQKLSLIQKAELGDFPGSPVVNNPPANAGDTGSIPGLGRFRMQYTTTAEPMCCNYRGPKA